MKPARYIFFLVCVVVATADTKFDRPERSSLLESRIIGGEIAENGQFPYQVSLRHRIQRNHYCGASLISNRFILTAAHCAINVIDPFIIYAVIGALHLEEGGVAIDIDTITVHEEFNVVNDIALLRTAEDVKFSELIQPIALPTKGLSAAGTLAILSGWGRTTANSGQSNDLKFTETSTIPLDDCIKKFDKYPNLAKMIQKSMICAFKESSGRPCDGDSGGPLADVSDPQNKSLIGIVSWGSPECIDGYPDVYTQVYSFVDWINKKIEQQSKHL